VDVNAPAATAPFLAAVALLGGAGLAKLWRPDDTAGALRVAGLPSHRHLVRAGAALEVAIAAGAVAAPGRFTGSLVAVAYLAFSAFVAIALLRRWPIASCGCFGRADARPGFWHLVLDAGATVAACSWAVDAPAHLGSLFVRSPGLGLVSAVIAGLAYAVWTNPLDRLTA
jgi:hypothetical protein